MWIIRLMPTLDVVVSVVPLDMVCAVWLSCAPQRNRAMLMTM